MSEHGIAKCGLHLVPSDEETNESQDAKLALAEKLVDATSEDEECHWWTQEIWYGYLSAVMDVDINYTEHGAEPSFRSLWELKGDFSDELRPFDDLYAHLAETELGETARYAVERLVSRNDKGQEQDIERRGGELTYKNPEYLALGRPYAKAIADSLRKQAAILERIWSDPNP